MSGLLEKIIFQPLKFQASDHFDKSLQNYIDCVKLEASLNSHSKRWSPFICLMALASVLGLPNQSLYPESGNRHASSIANALILPRERKSVNHSPLHLMWLVCALPQDKKALCMPNHIVPVFVVSNEKEIHPVQNVQLKILFQRIGNAEPISTTSSIPIASFPLIKLIPQNLRESFCRVIIRMSGMKTPLSCQM